MSAGLRITVPVKITAAMLVSTDVAEADYPAWSSGSTYTLADRRIKNHVIWESIQASNTNHDPEEAGSAWWTKVSATNQWKLFDLNQVTSTAQASAMEYQIEPGAPIDAVHVLGLSDTDAVQLRIYDADDDSLEFDGGENAAGILPTALDWWGYCYGPWTLSDQQHYKNLPYVIHPRVRVNFTGGAALATQVLMLGNDTVFGADFDTGVISGVRIRFDRSSSFTNNEFDIPTMSTSALITTATFTLQLKARDVDALVDFYRENGAKVCMFTIAETWRTTQILGVITSMEPLIDGPNYSTFAFEIRGVPQQ